MLELIKVFNPGTRANVPQSGEGQEEEPAGEHSQLCVRARAAI